MAWLLHNIGESPSPKGHIKSNYTTRQKVHDTDGKLTFDGIYKNVYENRDLLVGREVILFVMGDYVGKDNSFDVGMPPEKFCTWDEIMDLHENYKCKLGWHTKSHRDLTLLTDEELIEEIKPPFEMDSFAYPYGKYNQRVIDVVKKYYKDAYSVNETSGDQYTKPRWYVR